MTPAFSFCRVLIIFNSLVCVRGGTFVEPSSPDVFSVAEEETRLPCLFQPVNESVVQVIWTKEKQDGTKAQIITAHLIEGQQESPDYVGRVRFEGNPMVNSALIMMKTELADEGKYTCTITTFPSGNLDAHLSLTVWTSPISTLDSFTLVEGQSFRSAAKCRSVAKPQPGLSWDTDLPGQSDNRSLENGASSIQFSLHPLRSMNGRKLDCLVWHPSLKSPRRHSGRLVVHYPPSAVITGYDENWYVGREGVTLQCTGEGNPKPETFNWTRKDGGLPEGVTVEKGLLRFNRPLASTDKGVYECTATNVVNSGKFDLAVNVTGPSKPPSFDGLLLIIIGSGAAALLVILLVVFLTVNRYYKRKNSELILELKEKKEEISTLSRQASIRRVSSINTDHKYQMDEILPLRIEGTMRNSLSSLDHPRSRDSRSTLGGLDSLGRPAIYNTSRRGRERMMERDRDVEREESHFLPPLQTIYYPVDQNSEAVRSRNGSVILPPEGRPQSGGGSRAGSRSGSRGQQLPLSSSKYPTLTDEDEDDLRPAEEDSGVLRSSTEVDGLENGGSETASSQISEAMSNHFEHTNGMLWPKLKPNNIVLASEATRIPPAHNSMMHHQPQIV